MQIAVNSVSARSPKKSRELGQALLWALCACLGFAGSVSHADEDDPSSRVARISYLKGPVYVQTADDDSWSDAKINRPLTSGDQLWTDTQGRSELQMGSITVQVDANTQLRIAALNDDQLQLVVTQGLVNVRVRQLDKDDEVEISTPNAAVTPLEPGAYRIETAAQDDLTVVQVREGAVQIAGAKQDFKLDAGEQLSLRGTKRLTAEFDELASTDDFDRWARDRNDRAERVASSRYVSADVIGYEDLDDYGSWRSYDDYGYVWVPTRVRSGWAPYRYGHWTWVSPWGWTWIDDAPWGFAPFHYGRWAMLDRRWCWVPGPRTVRAVYAPALVAWVGTPGVSVSINIGRQPVGWIPLGPREVYRPYYPGSHNYVTRVNLSNARFNTNDFERDYRRQPHDADYRNRGATSVVQANTLRAAQPVNKHLIRAGREPLRPLNSQPVTRSERNEAGNPSRQFTPPVAPNTREVLTRRGFSRRDDSQRMESRNEVTPAGPRNSRDRYIGDPRIPSNQDSRATSPAPSIRGEASPRPYDRPANTPTPQRAPEVAPRVRNEHGVRDEMQLGGRAPTGSVHERHAAPVERQRTMPAPNDPPPPRGVPAPMQPAPMTSSPRMPNPEARPQQRNGDDNGRLGHDNRIR